MLAPSALAAPARADDYPNRSIRLIIPFPSGGSNDVVGRIVAAEIAKWGPIVKKAGMKAE